MGKIDIPIQKIDTVWLVTVLITSFIGMVVAQNLQTKLKDKKLFSL